MELPLSSINRYRGEGGAIKQYRAGIVAKPRLNILARAGCVLYTESYIVHIIQATQRLRYA
jgi:hypothetical protein